MSSSSASEDFRELSPSTRKFRSLSPFVTPDKKLNIKKYNEFLQKCDVMELHYYQNSFNVMSVKYPKEVTSQAQKQIKKYRLRKWSIIILFTILFIFACLLLGL